MKKPFFLKMKPWQVIRKFKKNRPGSSTLLTAFIFVIFSTLGMSMLYTTQIYLKLNSYKRLSFYQEYAAENGIKQAFYHLVKHLTSLSSPVSISDYEYYKLRENAHNQGILGAEKLLQNKLPLTYSQSWKNMTWESSINFFFKDLVEKKDYFQITYATFINSQGKLNNFSPHRETCLEAETKILGGKIPLNSMPILIDKKLNPNQKENYLQKNNITVFSEDNISLPPAVNFSEGELLPEDAYSQLSAALNINIFYPQDLSPIKLRKALRLELNNEPVPEGVYLIKDNLGLGGIFVQGDVQEMVLAIQENYQVISFLTNRGLWILKFNPSKSHTLFISPHSTSSYDLIPLGIIIVNGKIASLGGGIVEPSGNISMVKEKEIPCLLQGVRLSIICSEQITLSSHLIQEGVEWQEGIPYLKDSSSQLTILATGKDFLDHSPQKGEIVIHKHSPQNLKIQASITASGEGFNIEGQKKTVNLYGSIHTSNFSSSGNRLHFRFDDRFLKDPTLLENTPQTAHPLLYLSSFQLRQWNEY